MFWSEVFVVKTLHNPHQDGKKVAYCESGKPYEVQREQERRKSEPRAADKRPKSTERHVGDA